MAATVTDDFVPSCYQEAISCEEQEEWDKAMKSEIRSLKKNGTWHLVDRPKDRKVIKSRWVFAVKRKPDGSLIKFKARQVAKGFSQVAGVDYTEVFAPVARAASIRTVLSLSASEGMKMLQFDVCTAFLYGDLDEEIFMEQPEGFSDGTGRVCRLRKGLYGLKQASRQWNKKFTDFLRAQGLKPTDADPCIFASEEGAHKLILCLYVDDGLICCKSEKRMAALVRSLKKEFDVTTQPVSCFVGMEVVQEKDTVAVHQEGYIRKMLHKFGMENCKPASTPAEAKLKLTAVDSAREGQSRDMTDVPYREAVGSLLYAAVISRPDIAFVVSQLAKHVSKPTQEHWTAVKRVFRYLQGTLAKRIVYRRGSSSLSGFSDADWGGDRDSRRSTTGFVFMLNGGPVAWQSRLQSSVALSSLEAEYMAMSEATKECIWLRRLLSNLGHEQREKTPLKVDNQSALSLAENPEFHTRSKHIDIRYHFVREAEVKGAVNLQYVASEENMADVLTKPLSGPAFDRCLTRMKLGTARGRATD